MSLSETVSDEQSFAEDGLKERHQEMGLGWGGGGVRVCDYGHKRGAMCSILESSVELLDHVIPAAADSPAV